MELTEIKYRKNAEIAWITLNRPEKMNALTARMLAEWNYILEEIENDPSCAVLIVNGAGKAWSAGVDLSVFQTIKVEPGYPIWHDGDTIMRRLKSMPQVTIAMVNGHSFTGAMEIMMAFDLIYCADEAKIGDTHAKWGIPPKWGMTVRLAHQVGLRKAKELSFTAKPITGQEAERIGLVNKSVPAADLEALVLEVAQQIVANSAQTIAAEKILYNYGATHSLDESLAFEQNYKMLLSDKKDTLKNFKDNL